MCVLLLRFDNRISGSNDAKVELIVGIVGTAVSDNRWTVVVLVADGDDRSQHEAGRLIDW